MGRALFSARYRHTLDEKKRVIIPANWRQHLKDTFYVHMGMNDECIGITPGPLWEASIESLRNTIDPLDYESQEYVNSLSSLAWDRKLDGAGRVLLPEELRERAGIEAEVVLLGAHDHIEIYDVEKLKAKEVAQDRKEMQRKVYERYRCRPSTVP